MKRGVALSGRGPTRRASLAFWIWLTALTASTAGLGLWIALRGMGVTDLIVSGVVTLGVSGVVLAASHALSTTALASLGFVVARREPGNPIGWIMLGLGAWGSFTFFVSMLLERLATVGPGVPDAGEIANWLGGWTFVPIMTVPLTIILMLVPDGRPISTKWKWLILVAGIGTAGWATAEATREFMGVAPNLIPNPFHDPRVFVWADASTFFVLPGLLGGVTAMVLRLRRAEQRVRQQLKWIAFGGGVAVSVMLAVWRASLVQPSTLGANAVAIASLAMLITPAAIALAIVRYRLYDIDVVIHRTVLFVLLAGFITGVYALIVVGLGRLVGSQSDLVLSVFATAVIAIAFEPTRLRAHRWADRVAYGNRASPYEVLSDLAERLSSAESTEGLLNRTAQRLADGTGAERASVWVTAEGGLLQVGQWPVEEDGPGVFRWEDLSGTVVEIESEGERLGALCVEKRRGDPVTATEARLIEDLAGASAPLLKHLGLQADLKARAAELSASRQRLVEVQSVERRRLERDLDEGAQQLVVSLKVKLNVAARLARQEAVEPLAEMLETMDHEARVAINQIRSLARGLYPQHLEEEGLASAVRSLAAVAPVPVEVELHDLDRLPAGLEATVFFVISEAITNAAKHAPGRPIKVTLTQRATQLDFSVADQGPGFDPQSVELGSGLRNMADRLDTNGGQLTIRTTPGHGTTIQGQLPLPARVTT